MATALQRNEGGRCRGLFSTSSSSFIFSILDIHDPVQAPVLAVILLVLSIPAIGGSLWWLRGCSLNLVVVLFFQVLLSSDYVRKTHRYLNFFKAFLNTYFSRFKKVAKQIIAHQISFKSTRRRHSLIFIIGVLVVACIHSVFIVIKGNLANSLYLG